MIKRPGQQQLLLPVSPFFMWASLVAALLVNMVPIGRAVWMPDLLALVIVFWGVHQPSRVGIGAAFVFGLCMDVHQSSMLGQHALSYTTLGFFAITIHRRLLWYPVLSQALQVLPLFALSQVIEVITRMIGGGVFPGWTVLISPAIEAALWPLATALLLAPQRRTPEPDENRPL
ncbi:MULTISPECIES: rod shape-determining protein MreD [Variovorax]|jgi:rod shape-determining protein MreD|uniref:rod shape-determining protein MreD n=1 Tax=Variovorax TaxID=34072 RepID=UPI00086CE6AE|nr:MULTISPECIES: rod shape-determining protein MreD [Variovorax]MBN8754255.1 rod shape-determining protein MreD [Variovorax sp.]ODU18549.1 MAG: rod shape-determining protein MreD [Variovorax sp. SCN 67-85]ODV25468.1 MAG: rod shape-determining protein MreD [Variovorax sp. SCN 67-20]OJZ05037.1 MAG: rod shape-determining protein MreD [Variovorax sp. 67-131]UKI09042.1 rod shape-determining protein MreD [Variovorax paradoxus]